MKKLFVAGLLLLSHNTAFGHAEHDKARYVSPDGVDEGRCENYDNPCKTIGYASSKANKGDKVLVAKGQYAVKNLDELFYLTSQLVPTYGGYSVTNHFEKANPKANPTYLSGIPLEYREALQQRGFTVVADAKAYSKETASALSQKLANYQILSQSQTNQACVDGNAGGFPCENVDLVSHVPLNDFGLNPSAANDIWGHVDLNTGIEYAIIGLRNGAAVVSLENPYEPEIVGEIDGLRAVWRDIKVYQYFDTSFAKWRAYAYVSTDGANDSVTIIDLSDLANGIREVGKSSDDSSLHNIYISNVNYSTGVSINGHTPRLHSMGSDKFGGAHRSYSLANPEMLVPEFSPTEATRSDYTHDGTSFIVYDDRVATNCQRDDGECDVFVDFNENEMRLWDQTDGDSTKELGSGRYDYAAYTHSGWWTEDKRYVLVHDELDEQTSSNPVDRTNVIIFDVADLNNPQYVGRWEGPTPAIDHNGFVRGNRYYMSNYERGMTVLDISNPEQPTEIGYFDSYPVSDNAQFFGAWGVYPFLPSGLILVSDINSGLYVLKDNTKEVAQGSLVFESTSTTLEEGDAAIFTINRVGGSTGAVSVEYRTLTGSASEDDFEATTGVLTWADGDTAAKNVIVQTTIFDEPNELTEQFSLELFNPQGGATLANTGASWVTIIGADTKSAVEFAVDSATVFENLEAVENVTQIQVPVTRFPPFDDEVTVSFETKTSVSFDTATEGQDFTLQSTSVMWAAGDSEDKILLVNVIDDDASENDEEILIRLVHGDSSRAADHQEFTIVIRDNESNTAPQVSSQGTSAVSFSNFALKNQVTISDDDANLSYLWTQESGPAVAIQSADSLEASVSTAQTGVYEFKLVVTDPFGESGETTFTLEDLADVDVEEPKKSSSGFSFGYLPLVFGAALVALRRRKKMIKH